MALPKRNKKGRFVKGTRTRTYKARSRPSPKRRTSTMPRRRGTYRARARSYGRGLMGGMQGKLMKVGIGAAGAIAAKVGGNFNSQFGPAAGLGAVGFFANNETLLTLAGMSLAQNLPIPGIGGSSGNTGAGWY